MKFPSKGVFYIFLFGLTQKAVTLECQSPQYVIIGEEGIVECFFPNQFQAIVWHDSLNVTEALVTKIEKQDTGNIKVSGSGYEDGIYDIFLNGSLIIPTVTIYHNRTFKVTVIDENLIVNATVVVVATEPKDDQKEYKHSFPTAALVIIILIVVAAAGVLLGVIYYIRKHKRFLENRKMKKLHYSKNK
ncbi:hypothetical protein HOLleu_09347 [Holothuria leucospilota]|uniref:Uncharacterized protein n=1 Tax=Holothuria leucospilota TaxID=206669 RepID=A0A9Q1HEW2_HOLLE|nr:hypothetical protein HOLleu_09347 [Holothuria leucospilota]